MNASQIETHFQRIGAHAEIQIDSGQRRIRPLAIDVLQRGKQEVFQIMLNSNADIDLKVIDTQPKLRHLLLMSEQADGKHKFLCGHDERHWFVAGVPEQSSVSNVRTAFEALKPQSVQGALRQFNVRRKNRNKRKNEAYLRQGEWFFVKQFRAHVNDRFILRNEPISRGGGKPHICQELVRQGGELVYVCPQYRNGLVESRFKVLLNRKPRLAKLSWVAMRRNPTVYVRGTVRHADHKTIHLDGWHQVVMNTENQSKAMQHVAFID